MDANVQWDEPTAEVFRFDEFTFDCGSRQLLCGSVERRLSPKAQQLLHALLLVRPRALSRQELYDALWPSTFVSETNLASVVNEVRRALGEDAKCSQYIRTVHGFGYAFCGSRNKISGVVAARLLCDGESYDLREGRNLVGRAPDCQVIIDARTVSRRHAVITVSADVITIEDAGSKNGTVIDGQRVGTTPAIVHRGARIEFGILVATIIHRKLTTTATMRFRVENTGRGAPGVQS